MIALDRKTSLAAAHVKHDLGITDPVVLLRLATTLGELGVYEPYNVPEDEWDDYKSRCDQEEQHDSDVLYNHSHDQSAEEHLQGLRLADHAQKALEACPEVKIRQKLASINVVDPSSIDYQDPEDGNNTPLHKAVLDNDIHEVKRLIKKGACLLTRNNDSMTPFGLAKNMGHFSIATVIKDAKMALTEGSSSARAYLQAV